MFIFDPSVEAYGYRVNNIGRLNDRQNLLIAGSVVALIGAVMAIFGPSSERPAEASPELRSNEERARRELKFRQAIVRCSLSDMERMLRSGEISAGDPQESGTGWLQYTTGMGAVPQCQLLLKFGADPHAKDGHGHTAIEIASRECRELFREYQAWTRPDPAAVAALITPAAGTSPPSQSPLAACQGSSVVEQLEKLAALRDAGALTPTEFEAAKARLLGLTSTVT